MARRLRRQSTAAERAAWRLLRNRGVLGLKFRRQHRLGRFIVDFYCPALRLVLELDGGYHAAAEQQARDAARAAALGARGLHVVRVANADVTEAHLVALIQPYASPLSPLRGCGEGTGVRPLARATSIYLIKQ